MGFLVGLQGLWMMIIGIALMLIVVIAVPYSIGRGHSISIPGVFTALGLGSVVLLGGIGLRRGWFR